MSAVGSSRATACRMTRDVAVVLVLSGGNALGAFQAGVYEALHEHDLQPEWIIGASVGAVNAALIAGTPEARRIETLRAFWQAHAVGPLDVAHPWLSSELETSRRTAAAAWTAVAGRSGVFGPLLSAQMPWSDDRPSIYETDQLTATLERLVDFDLLNVGACRFTATAVDIASGEDVVFDSTQRRIAAEHIRASAALPVLFPPVEVDGRWLVDGGLSANLPLDPVLGDPPARPTLCVAVDLLPLSGDRPRTLGEAAGRMQDLTFAAQSSRSIARWQAVYAGRDDHRVALARLPYAEQRDEVAGKALDFSGPTLARRWTAGHRAGMRLLEALEDGSITIDVPGLTATVVA